MKKLILILCAAFMVSIVYSQMVVVYNSDDPYSSAAAAIVDQKYGINSLDVAVSDSAAQATWYLSLLSPADSSYVAAYILCDTARPYAADKFLGQYTDSLKNYAIGGTSADMHYWNGTANATKCEMAWDSLYTGITPPLIVGYLSEKIISYDRADASGGTDSTIFKANATGWTNGAWIGDYVVITAGPGIGEGLVIEDLYALVSGDADSIEVTGKFSTAITSGSDFTVLPSSIYAKWAFYDMYAYYGVLLLLDDIDTHQGNWLKLLNNNRKLNNIPLGSGRAPRQDRAYLKEVLEAGEHVFNYLVETN